jgi:methylmalonyl-CoA mutase N-terminal domain/subunit
MKNKFQNSSGYEVQEIYRELPETFSSLGEPGAFPFIRGVQKDMYRGRHWTMRQYAGFGSAKESNKRYKFLLSKGQTGLSVAFDLPTQLGYDPDHGRSLGEVGKVGVSIACLSDMRELFDGIKLEDVSTSMTINATAGILLGLYVAVAKEQGADLKALRGTVQNDLLKEYVARGNYIYPPKASLQLTTDLIEYCKNEIPKWNPISISGYHIREAGSTAAQEIAFTLANALAYVDAALSRGLSIDDFAPRLSFFFNVHNDFMEEVAKFRAARKIWATMMRDRYGAKNEKSMALRFHAQTGGSTLTAQQPENNIMRVAFQAMAAVMGGCQSLHTNGFDEALALPTERAARLALRTQQIIAYETGITSTVDPLGGSYYLESLTLDLEKRALSYLDTIAAKGGVVRCIEDGYVQGEIADAAYAAQRAIESGEAVVVGVNKFTEAETDKVPLQRVSESLGKERADFIKKWRSAREANLAKDSLLEVTKAAEEGRNTMPHVIKAVESGVTLGEISDAFRKVFGTHREYTGF